MRFAPLALVVALGLTTATAQPVIDGTLDDPQYTLLDDNTGGPVRGFGDFNNLNALYAYAAGDVLYVGVAGSVENASNRIVVFLDTRPGGYGSGDYDNSQGPGAVRNFNAGSTFDAGFEADFALAIGTDGTRTDYFVDLVELRGTRSGGPNSINRFLGSAGSSAQIAAVTNDGAPQTTEGFEIAIPYADVTSPTGAALAVTKPTIQAFALLSADNGFLSNLFLSPAGSGQGNFEAGAVSFGTEPPDPLRYTLPISTSGTAGYRLLSVPGAALSVDALAQIDLVSGAGGYTVGDECARVTNLFTFYTGDETAPNGGYTAPATGATLVQPGAGFFWYFFGADNPNDRFPTACEQSGGAASVARGLPLGLPYTALASESDVTVTVSGRAAEDDAFYLAGNPFTEGFDLEDLASGAGSLQASDGLGAAVALSNVVQAYTPEGGPVMFTATADTGSDGSGGTDPSDDVSVWQGFFVEAVDPADEIASLTYRAAFRTGGSAEAAFTGRAGGAPLAQVRLALTGALATGAAVGDDAIGVVFAPGSSEAWDAYDASKLAPFSADFAELALLGAGRAGDPVAKASDSHALDAGETVVPGRFRASGPGTFTLGWDAAPLPAGWTAVLRDLDAGAERDLTVAGSYAFTSDGTAAERFEIVVTPLVVATEAGPESLSVGMPHPNPASGTATVRIAADRPQPVRVEVVDLLGRRVATVFDGVLDGTTDVPVALGAAAPGVYVVRVTGETVSATRRLTITR